MVVSGDAAPAQFGHGDAAGTWFLWVNLARDYLSLMGQETSLWDGWRIAIGHEPAFDSVHRASCEALAEGIRRLEDQRPAMGPPPALHPFWLDSAEKPTAL